MPELKDRLEALASDGEPRGAIEVMRRARHALDDGRHRPHRHRRVLVPLAAAAAVVALAVGAVALVNRSGDEGPSVVASGGEPPSDETLLLVPSFVPEGFELIQASGGDQPGASAGGGDSGADWQQHYVRFDAAHEHPLEILHLAWATDARFDDLVTPPPGAVSTPVRGRDGWYSAEIGWLVWEEPQGQRVTLQGSVAGEGPTDQTTTSLPLDFLLSVAEALEPREDGGFNLPDPPEGFELVAEAPGEYSNGTNPRTLAYRGSDGRGLWLNLVDDSERPPGMSLYHATDRLVDVRGHQGVLTRTRGALAPGTFDQETLFIADGADLHLQWVEPGNVQVTMSGVGLSEAELLAIAEGLESVDAQTWFGLQIPLPSGTDDLNDIEPSRTRVLVWNAGSPDGSASMLTNSLRAVGYNLLPAGNAPAASAQSGNAVQCRDPFASAAAALASSVRSAGYDDAQPEPFAEPPPGIGAEDADCIVYLGE